MGALETWEPTLLAVAARCLRVRPEAMDPAAPLARYGLDSLNACELGLAITEATGIEIGEDLLLDSPSIHRLSEHLLGRITILEEPEAYLQRMRSDAELAADIDPASVPPAAGGAILLTGATGFLGAHLLARLLESKGTSVVCAVRANTDAAARERLCASLARFGVRAPALDEHVRVIAADIAQPTLGLRPRRYAELAAEIGSVVHCAAAVDWVAPYDGLHAINVGATEALLRFASTATRKAFHFVSSAAACRSSARDEAVTEDGPTADLAAIHMGYGQTKWVAERLVEAAQVRGMAGIIYRPSLIGADAASGLGNDDDLLARLLRGCIASGHAPDLDWELDVCPVDFVARAMAAAVTASARVDRILHLRNPRAMRWSEAVLWMNLRGYPVRLEPFADWIERVERDSRRASHPLHPLRGFLLRRIESEAGLHLPQLYTRPHAARFQADRSDAALADLGVECPRLGVRLLKRTFDNWVRRGVLHDAPVALRDAKAARVLDGAAGSVRTDPEDRPAADWDAALEAAFRQYFDEPGLTVTGSVARDFGAEHSILGELASWRAGSDLGMHARSVRLVRADGRRSCVEIVVKPKLPDAVVLDVAAEVATQADPALGAAFEAYRDESELAGAGPRELALYAGATGAMRAHMPVWFGTVDIVGTRALLLERVRDCALIDAVDRPAAWTPEYIEAALAGAARMHAQWLGHEDRLGPLDVSAAVVRGSVSPAAEQWWLALSQHARPWLEAWLGTAGWTMQRRLAQQAKARAAAMATHACTLIHHDFNPRNIALRRTALGPQLCAFDWELAEYGLPQRDLVELLCFVLPADVEPEVVDRYLEYGRCALEQAALVPLDSAKWLSGARLALADFGVRRLPMYFIAHRFRPQSFLERVTHTWARLTALL